MRAVALLVALAVAGQAPATDFSVPEQSIVGADATVEPGELVDLSISRVRDRPEHYVSSSYAWRVLDITAGGREVRARQYKDEVAEGVLFGAGMTPRRLKVVAVATHLYVVRGKDGAAAEVGTRTVIHTADLQVGKPPAPPPTPPTPPVPPPPTPPDPPAPPPAPLPDGKYGLAKFTWFEAVAKVSKDTAGTRAKTARAMAASFRGVAAAIAAGTVKSDREVLQKTADANYAALEALCKTPAETAELLKLWQPFSKALQSKLYPMYESGAIKTLDDYRTAWLEIADGLDAVDAQKR